MRTSPVLRDIAAVLRRYGPWAYGSTRRDLYRTTHRWAAAGFTPEEVEAWLKAGCFDPDTAQAFVAAGLTPTDAAQWTDEAVGMGGYQETLGHKAANGDLDLAEAIAYVQRLREGQ